MRLAWLLGIDRTDESFAGLSECSFYLVSERRKLDLDWEAGERVGEEKKGDKTHPTRYIDIVATRIERLCSSALRDSTSLVQKGASNSAIRKSVFRTPRRRPGQVTGFLPLAGRNCT